MKNKFLEAGQIVNTHGVRGEVKIVPWCDSPEFLCQFDTFYIDGAPISVKSARPQKTNVLAQLVGVTDVNDAMRLKGKVLSIDRTQVTLPNGRHFLADMVGLKAIDDDTEAELGTIAEVLTPPAHAVYVIRGQHEYMVPAVNAFIKETNVEAGYVRIHLIEGMQSDV